MAVEHDRHNASGAAISYYERPAAIALLGDVNGKRVLEVGCVTGPATEWLVDHGAEVVACDVSVAMLEIARSRVGDSAELHHHDLAEPLTFLEDASVDLVVALLVFQDQSTFLTSWLSWGFVVPSEFTTRDLTEFFDSIGTTRHPGPRSPSTSHWLPGTSTHRPTDLPDKPSLSPAGSHDTTVSPSVSPSFRHPGEPDGSQHPERFA